MLIPAQLGHMARDVLKAVIVTMGRHVTILMGGALAPQDIPDPCAKRNALTELLVKIAKKHASVKMKGSVMWLMEAVNVVMDGRVHSAKRGFVTERSYTVRIAR